MSLVVLIMVMLSGLLLYIGVCGGGVDILYMHTIVLVLLTVLLLALVLRRMLNMIIMLS